MWSILNMIQSWLLPQIGKMTEPFKFDKGRWRHASNHPGSSKCRHGLPKDLLNLAPPRQGTPWSPGYGNWPIEVRTPCSLDCIEHHGTSWKKLEEVDDCRILNAKLLMPLKASLISPWRSVVALWEAALDDLWLQASGVQTPQRVNHAYLDYWPHSNIYIYIYIFNT